MSNQITGHTGLICLLGSPCKHSISPMMHNKSFELLGLDYRYLAFEVTEDTLETAVKGLKVMGARGFNLTMPCKNKVVSLCDKLSPAARLIGAVNTVVNDNGILTGHNTDGIGYMQSVKDAGYDIIGKKMTLLGAGGAATAVCVQAALDGVKEINIFSIKDTVLVASLLLLVVFIRPLSNNKPPRPATPVAIPNKGLTAKLKAPNPIAQTEGNIKLLSFLGILLFSTT